MVSVGGGQRDGGGSDGVEGARVEAFLIPTGYTNQTRIKPERGKPETAREPGGRIPGGRA